MKKIISLALISMMTLNACAGGNSEAEVGGTTETANDGTGSKVYFTKTIGSLYLFPLQPFIQQVA